MHHSSLLIILHHPTSTGILCTNIHHPGLSCTIRLHITQSSNIVIQYPSIRCTLHCTAFCAILHHDVCCHSAPSNASWLLYAQIASPCAPFMYQPASNGNKHPFSLDRQLKFCSSTYQTNV